MSMRQIFQRLAQFDFGVLLDLPPTEFWAFVLAPFYVPLLLFVCLAAFWKTWDNDW